MAYLHSRTARKNKVCLNAIRQLEPNPNSGHSRMEKFGLQPRFQSIQILKEYVANELIFDHMCKPTSSQTFSISSCLLFSSTLE